MHPSLLLHPFSLICRGTHIDCKYMKLIVSNGISTSGFVVFETGEPCL